MSRKSSLLLGLTGALSVVAVVVFLLMKQNQPATVQVLAVQGLQPTAAKLDELLEALQAGEERVVERWDLRGSRELVGWTAEPDVVSMRPTEAGLEVVVSPGYPLLWLKQDVDFDDFNALRVRMLIGDRTQAGLYRVGASWNWGEDIRGDVQVYREAGAQLGTDGVQEIELMLGQHGNWGFHRIFRFGFVPLFFDYPDQPDTVVIESIELLHVPAGRLLAETGWSSGDPRLTYDRDTRLAFPAPADHDWRSEEFVPDEETRLVFEGALPRMMASVHSRLEFLVEAWQGERRLGVVAERVATLWEGQGVSRFSHEASLAQWEGEKIHLRFHLGSPSEGRAARGGIWIEPRLQHRGTVRAERARPRRVVLVTLDTTRPDFLGPYGNTEVETPFLDELARRGTLFEACYATANSTSPSHASILTSLHVQDHRVENNGVRLSEEAQTVAEHFRAAGYRTAAAVSIFHLDHANSGFAQGFDHFIAPALGDGAPTAGETNERLFALLEEELADQPLFLWVHYFDPHAPYLPPEGYDRMYYQGDPTRTGPGLQGLGVPDDPGSLDYWRWLAEIRDPEFVRAQYAAEITYTDAQLRVLYERLNRDGIEPVFVVTADHGESLGERGIFVEHLGLHDPVTRVPLIWSGPGVPEERRVGGVSSTVDIAPTLLELAKLPGLDRARGLSLVSSFGAPTAPSRDVIFEHSDFWQSGFRRGNRKYLRSEVDLDAEFRGYQFVAGREEVYDLDEDPAELRNLAREARVDLETLRTLYQNQRKQRYHDLKPQPGATNHALERALQSLGYTGTRSEKRPSKPR